MQSGLTKALAWLGDNPLGALCAGLLLYVVAGNLAGIALAVPLADKHLCWPGSVRFVIIVACDDVLAGALWHGAVELPNALLWSPVIALSALTMPPIDTSQPGSYAVVDTTALTIGVMSFTLFSLMGFAAWHTRAPAMAWLLLLALAGEIAYLASIR